MHGHRTTIDLKKSKHRAFNIFQYLNFQRKTDFSSDKAINADPLTWPMACKNKSGKLSLISRVILS